MTYIDVYLNIYRRCKEILCTGYTENYRPTDKMFTEPLKEKSEIVAWFKNGNKYVVPLEEERMANNDSSIKY